MIKTLTQHGNSAALVIDKALLEVLNIDLDTKLEIVTDGENLLISPVRDPDRQTRLSRSLERVNAKHGTTLKKLAQ